MISRKMITFAIALFSVTLIAFTVCGCESDPAPYTEKTNESSAQATETIETTQTDAEAPIIVAPQTIFTSVGAVIRYKSYITVTDNEDSDVRVTVDNSNVNLAVPGKYAVIYTATDSAGNSSEKSVNVIVNDQVETDYSDEVIYSRADEILDQIITDEMTDLEKVFAVFYHVRDNYYYVPDQKHWSYKQEAYDFIINKRGSCYGNVSLSQLLLEQLGYNSVMVEGSMGLDGETHFWNLVSIDGGQNWYIYDAIWVMYDDIPLCMMTKGFVEALAYRNDYEYKCDWTAYPPVADEPLWTIDDFKAGKIPISPYGK